MAALPGEQPSVIIDFLQSTLPFSLLDQAALRRLAAHCTVDFHPAGSRVLVRDQTRPRELFVVQKGGVKLTLRNSEDQETLLDYRGEGGCIGELALLQNRPAPMDATTVEDTFFLVLPGDEFLNLIKTQPLVAEFFLRDFSETFLPRAFAEMRERHAALSCDSGLYLFSTRLAAMCARAPVCTCFGESIQMGAWKMSKHRVGSLLVREPSGRVAGIVTDKDLRKAVALGMDYAAPIETIMSTPVVTMDEGEVCFDALLQMMTRQIHHLAVTRDDEVTGVVTSHDIMVLQGKSPMAVFRDIQAQERLEGLHPISERIPQVLRTLVEEGARAGHITRMITVINDLILEKLLTLLLKEIGPPPVPFCWLLLGSEGRREQTVATDQDNALVYRDPGDPILQRAADIYLTAFAERAIQELVRCGFPSCPGEIMASNPKWRQPLTVWRNYFERWIMVPNPQEVLNATIFFDFRPAFGELELASALREHVARHAPRQDVFLRHLAADCLQTRPPLSFFKNFVVEKTGEHKNRLNIKQRGLVPFVDFARVLALRHGLAETNTLGRLRRLKEDGHLPEELAKEAGEAFEFLLQLRLVHQLGQVEDGRKPDNHVAPTELSELERQTLKEAFSVIGRLHGHLRDVFRLELG
ncbi:MAG: putative nucleotidyltransferase substrate binding domain-containing protein [Desulfovibrio sp.]|nr:putative nucleotidyltransferase substrate binding domain-containing protein [Desulfovibrio sp.]